MDIEKKRKDIDEIDDYIIKLFLKRMQVCGDIGRYKRENGLRAYDEKRENEIFERIRAQTPDEMREYADLLYETVLGLSNAYQLEIINGEIE